MIYTPSEMVGTKRNGHTRNIGGREVRTICTSHVERLNGTQRLFMKRLNRLTYCFSKKLRKPGSGFRHVRGLLQFLLADPACRARAASFGSTRCDDGRARRSRLVVR